MEQPPIFTEEQRKEIKNVVHEALVEFFSAKGKLTKQVLVGLAVIVGSLTVIFAGFKAILGWLGFHYIVK